MIVAYLFLSFFFFSLKEKKRIVFLGKISLADFERDRPAYAASSNSRQDLKRSRGVNIFVRILKFLKRII